MYESRTIIIDAYNLIHRAPTLRPGPDRTLRQAREKLLNLLSWAVGGDSRLVVVFDGSDERGGEQATGRIKVLFSKPPEKADDLIRRLVEKYIGDDDRVTVVTADLEVARHARAMGADISLSDLFIAGLIGPTGTGVTDDPAADDKPPVTLTKQEVEQWAEMFTRGKPAAKDAPSPGDETKH